MITTAANLWILLETWLSNRWTFSREIGCREILIWLISKTIFCSRERQWKSKKIKRQRKLRKKSLRWQPQSDSKDKQSIKRKRFYCWTPNRLINPWLRRKEWSNKKSLRKKSTSCSIPEQVTLLLSRLSSARTLCLTRSIISMRTILPAEIQLQKKERWRRTRAKPLLRFPFKTMKRKRVCMTACICRQISPMLTTLTSRTFLLICLSRCLTLRMPRTHFLSSTWIMNSFSLITNRK